MGRKHDRLKELHEAWQRSLVGEALTNFMNNGGMIAAGNMAFLTTLSLFPFIIFLISLAGFLGRTDAGIGAIALMLESVPPEVAEVIVGPIYGVMNNSRGSLLTGGAVMAVWTAASGVEAARLAVIHAHGREHGRPIWRRRLESMAVVICAALIAIIAMTVQTVGPAVIAVITKFLQVPMEITGPLEQIWGLLRFGLVPGLFFVAIYILYVALSPRIPGHRRRRLPGAGLVLIVWMGTAIAFSQFIANAGRYDATYGSLAGVVLAQIFCFVISVGFVLGAELNAAASRRSPRPTNEAEPPKSFLEDDPEGEAAA